ncbi:MAG TPA: hypothetical protein VGQ35_05455 [Dongiaceae bacterium]|jgi:hypothetical protein|nr:hypothetical protein [Dongiaceae bacterium]
MFAAVIASRTPKLLSHVKQSDIVTEPYAHYTQTDVVPASLYQELAAEFPSLAVIVNERMDIGSNEAVRMTVKQVLSDRRISPLWREFFDYHTSTEYWRDVTRLFGEHFRREFPGLEERVGRAYEDWRVVPRGYAGEADVRLDCQFVMNTPVTRRSSVKTAHIDLCDKIFSALYYMRDPRDLSQGGDLDIYDWRREPRFVKHRTLMRDVELVKTVPYRANSYLCFVNSPQAVHGVSPREATDVPRRYINFIAELPVKAFEPKQLGRLQRMWYASEIDLALGDDKY